MASTEALPINAFRRPTIKGFEGHDVLDVPTDMGTVREVLKMIGAITPKNWQPGQKGIIAHRGLPSMSAKGEMAPECTLLAFQWAYDLGLLCSEADSSVDARKAIHYFHDKNLIGWTSVRGAIAETDISLLSHDQKQYVHYEIQDGQRTGEFQRTDQYIASLHDIGKLIKRNPEQVLLDDCRDDDPPYVAAAVSHLPPQEREGHIVQILSFRIRDAKHFIQLVEQNDPAPDWKETVMIVPSPHPHALSIIAEKHGSDMTVGNVVGPNWIWMKSFVDAGLRVVGFHTPRTGAALDYVNDTLAHFKGREVTTHPNLAPFIQDKAEEQLQMRAKEQYPHIPIISPSARPTWSKDGNHYLSGFHDPDVLTEMDLNKPIPHYFLQASEPANHYTLGVDIVVSDDVYSAALCLGNQTYLTPEMKAYKETY
ncbi:MULTISPECIES: hypothetical protein [Agrobacterium]|uniref:Uncharacterized protein n=1 Tax=Agrobacterium tumefaciens TaxID=358 RepID=A0AAW8M2S0_AGRTU|nr:MULTISPECIES: hypothetical protein [Agrobacterium]MBP2568493.1 hypothetical protein [Agrobacterium tumefaciens]MDR6705371.1 hypothetical protein [Agrobacterium tumefaciens]TCV45248.1 glycerophosphoryl diester phosphodiesterase [Agrobacterium tumefaciens]